MKKNQYLTLVAVVGASLSVPQFAQAQTLEEALSSGKSSVAVRLRYEGVEQDNALSNADATTVRTRVGYKTGDYKGFSAEVSMEDSRIAIGSDNFNDTNGNGAGYSVVPDPETTELDQAYLQYKNKMVSTKLGRQVVTMDNHRFVGHVGWRQDRQTFDGVSVDLTPSDKLSIKYAYLDERNRIFGEEKDIDSKDHLINASYKFPMAKVTAYGYLLDEDEGKVNELDTIGARVSGWVPVAGAEATYALEYAKQKKDDATGEQDAKYYLVEAGTVINGHSIKAGYEVLGASDDGNHAFSTPLATLHKFNGWADQFLGTPAEGLEDKYVSVSGPMPLLKGKYTVAYHDYDAEDSTPTVDDLGTELNLAYVKPVSKNLTVGVKYADYQAGDIKVDTRKTWVWGEAKF